MSGANLGRNMLVFASVLVVATVATAVWMMDSPAVQRDQRLDQRRVAELSQIQVLIEDWARSRGRLPASLSELAAQPGIALATKDPVDGTPYGYRVRSGRDYSLCASFATDSARDGQGVYPHTGHPAQWAHPAGSHCFDRSLPREDVPAEKPPPG